MNKKIILIIGIVVVVGIGLLLGMGGKNVPKVQNEFPAANQGDVQSQGIIPNQEVSVPPIGENGGSVPKKAGFSMSDVAMHNTRADCYAAVDGFVYDLTSWISQHPGGEENILKLCGTDGTAAFTRKHGMNQKAKDTLERFKVGTVLPQ